MSVFENNHELLHGLREYQDGLNDGLMQPDDDAMSESCRPLLGDPVFLLHSSRFQVISAGLSDVSYGDPHPYLLVGRFNRVHSKIKLVGDEEPEVAYEVGCVVSSIHTPDNTLWLPLDEDVAFVNPATVTEDSPVARDIEAVLKHKPVDLDHLATLVRRIPHEIVSMNLYEAFINGLARPSSIIERIDDYSNDMVATTVSDAETRYLADFGSIALQPGDTFEVNSSISDAHTIQRQGIDRGIITASLWIRRANLFRVELVPGRFGYTLPEPTN